MRAGSTFGDYKVIRLLGKGGMGEVWLLEGKSGRQVAAKILDAGADHESRKRFLREAQLALGVKNPNLVEAYDVGIDPASGLCYILMEYVSGGTLADRIKARGALPIEEAVSIVQAMASVLELGRQKGIVLSCRAEPEGRKYIGSVFQAHSQYQDSFNRRNHLVR